MTDKKLIEEADDAYYNSDTPIMSDAKYDSLRESFDKKQGGKNLKVGAKPNLKVSKLPMPMYSLDKYNEFDLLQKWIDRVGLSADDKVVLMLKFDGIAAIKSTSSNKAWTRGDGVEGTDISDKMDHIYGGRWSSLEGEYVWGECVAREDIPEKKNRRNAVGGILRSDDISDSISSVDFIAFGTSEGDFNTKEEMLDYINFRFQGEHRCPYVVMKISDLTPESILEAFSSMKEELPYYETDGVVIHIDDIGKCIDLGRGVSGNPEYAIAYKKGVEEIKETTVIGLSTQISKSGALVPVIHIEPVDLDGATVSKFTGYNYQWILDRGCFIGATVLVKRSGKVSPRLHEVIESVSLVDEFALHDMFGTCKECGMETVRRSVDVVCPNAICPGVEKARMAHFVSTLSVAGISDLTINRLHSLGYRDMPTILETDNEVLERIDGFGKVSVAKMKDNMISSVDGISVGELAHASGFFDGVGSEILSQILSGDETVSDTYMAKFLDADLESLQTWTDRMGKWHKVKENVVVDNSMEGITIVMTGFRSSSIEEYVKSRGGRVTTSISSKVTALIAKSTDSSSSKLTKARSLGVEVISVEQASERFGFPI